MSARAPDEPLRRNAWGPPMRFARKSERECARCDCVKVTRHEPGKCWTEYWRGFERLPDGATPPCDGRRER